MGSVNRHSAHACRILLPMFGLTLLGLASTALALPGYTNLINSYCRQQGTVRVRYLDDGCTLCHQSGTFTSAPKQRIEPVWTEFEIGRNSGNYSFFCPPTGARSAASALADAAAAAVDAAPQDASTPHASMPWMSLGYPTGHAASVAVDAKSRDGAANRSSAAAAPAAITLPDAAGAKLVNVTQDPSAELKRDVARLREEMGISRAQEPVWQELQEAIFAAAVPTTAKVQSPSLEEALQERQRRHALRIAQLRAVNTATIRLIGQLDDAQKRLLVQRLPPMLGDE